MHPLLAHPLLAIVRAAHCRSTHHYFAIDALPLVQTDAGKRLVRHLMRHHERYLTGAKDPDVRFRDFQNHVVHVADGYWGGAPRVAHKWYDRLQVDLDRGDYAAAAYAAGVLSHYFTDPIQPLHTGQTEREGVIHRPLEWSINQSYASIFQRWQDDNFRIVFQLADSPGWLGEAILHGARFAHRNYALLVDSYRLERGVRVPREGLTDEALAALSELFGLAITGWARVLERAASDAEARLARPIAPTSVTPAMIMAIIRTPSRLWLRHVESIQERRALELLVEEYRDTGKVVENLPAEVDIKQRVAKVHADEKRYRERLASKRLATTAQPSTIPMRSANTISALDVSVSGESHEARRSNASNLTSNEPREIDTASPSTIPFVQRESKVQRDVVTSHGSGAGVLSMHADLVDAPSIGPKTAARFYEIGVHKVGEFLAQNAGELAEKLNTRWITADTIGAWQSQTRLMCQLPGLRVRDVQLLVGAGIDSTEALSSRTARDIDSRVSEFGGTTAGLRYLRGAPAPTLDDIHQWRDAAIRQISSQRPLGKTG